MALLGAVVARAHVPAPSSAVGRARVAVSAMAEVWDLTTVADDEVVFHLHSPDPVAAAGQAGDWAGPGYEVITGLKPGSSLVRHGIETRTLERPPGELLCRFATVNDTHFGETECGALANVSDAVAYLAAAGGEVDAARDKLNAFLERLGPLVVNSVAGGRQALPGDDEPRRRHRDRRLRPRGGRDQGRPHRLGARRGVRGLPAVLPRGFRRPDAARSGQPRRFHRAQVCLRGLVRSGFFRV